MVGKCRVGTGDRQRRDFHRAECERRVAKQRLTVAKLHAHALGDVDGAAKSSATLQFNEVRVDRHRCATPHIERARTGRVVHRVARLVEVLTAAPVAWCKGLALRRRDVLSWADALFERSSKGERLEYRSGLHPNRATVRCIRRVVVGGYADALGSPTTVLSHGQDVSGAWLDHRNCGGLLARILRRHTAVDGSLRCVLGLDVERRLDDKSTALDEVLALGDGCAVLLVVLDLVDDEVTVERVLTLRAAVLQLGGAQGLGNGNGLGLLSLRGSDEPLQGHAVKYDVATNLGKLRVLRRVVADRLLHKPGKRRRLRQADLRGTHVEVTLRRSFNAVGASTEVADVQVALKDLLFRHFLFDGQGVAHFLQLAPDRADAGVFDLFFGFGVRDELVAYVLHRDRRAALLHVASLGVRHQCSPSALEVDAVVLVEARVFSGNRGLLNHGRNLIERHHDAVFCVQSRDPGAVIRGDVGALRQRLRLQLTRQRVERHGGLARGKRGGAYKRQSHGSDNCTGEGANE